MQNVVYVPSSLQPGRVSASSLGSSPSRSGSHFASNITNEMEITLPEIKGAGKAGAELYYARFL